MLADKTFQHIYSKSDAHRPIEFCLQALCNSVRLDLGLGYFSSASFNVLSLGMAHFIANNGRMNLYINKYISMDDYALLKGEYDEEDNSYVDAGGNVCKYYWQCRSKSV